MTTQEEIEKQIDEATEKLFNRIAPIDTPQEYKEKIMQTLKLAITTGFMLGTEQCRKIVRTRMEDRTS